MVEKLDFKKELAQLYAPKNKDWELVEVPVMNFLMVDGQGDPNTARDYSDAVEALYALAYAIKFLSRTRLGRDYVLAPLEGLWTANDPAVFENAQKAQYQWTMMIMQPDWIMESMVSETMAATRPRRTCPPCRRFGSRGTTKEERSNCSMWAHTMTRRQSSNIFMPNSCRSMS